MSTFVIVACDFCSSNKPHPYHGLIKIISFRQMIHIGHGVWWTMELNKYAKQKQFSDVI